MTLEEHLQSLQTSYIWNIYKQLTNEMLEKAAEMPYREFEGKFKAQIMEPLADTILTKTVSTRLHLLTCEDKKQGPRESAVQRVPSVQVDPGQRLAAAELHSEAAGGQVLHAADPHRDGRG